MIRSLMVCTDGSDSAATAGFYGTALAVSLQARLTGCHVLDTRTLEGPLLADISGWLGAQPYGAQVTQIRQLLEHRGRAILEAFAKDSETAGIEATTILRTGHPAHVILAEEACAELIILGQRGEHAEQTGEMIGSTVERVIRHSIKPCLITPATHRPIQRILIAFDGSDVSSKALHEGIELALALSVPLVLLTVAEEHDRDGARRIVENGMTLVRAHEGVAAQLVVEGRPDQVILAQAQELGCDLIVVGAYGHSRIREMILGSTTQNLVARAHCPVLLVR
jgi:nucleotide-binding universal stress UspA family protein